MADQSGEKAPQKFGKAEARKHTVANLINFAGDLFKGKVTLVPVHTSDYAERIDPLVKASGDTWGMDEFVVRKALRGDDYTMEEAEWHGSVPAAQEPGQQWRRGIIRHVANFLQG